MTWETMTKHEKVHALLRVACTEIAGEQCWLAGSRIIVAEEDGDYWTLLAGDLREHPRIEPFNPLRRLDHAWSVLLAAHPDAQILLQRVPPRVRCTIIFPGPAGQAVQAAATEPGEAICQAMYLAKHGGSDGAAS